MAAGGKGWVERARRGVKTAWFMVAMVASLLMASAPALVAAGDVAVALWLEVRLGCLRCHGLRGHLERYGFRSSLVDIPLVSIARSVVITCVYLMSDASGLSHGPYLGTATCCSLASLLILLIKASVYSPAQEIGPELSPSLADHKLSLKKLSGMPVLFLSSLVFALGHVVVAYRTSCRARRKLLIHGIDPESILAYKNAYPGCYKTPRSPTPYSGKFYSRSDSETKRKSVAHDDRDIPISFLADGDSMFIACQGITVHYKLSDPSSCISSATDTFPEIHHDVISASISPRRQRHDSPPSASTNTRRLLNRSFSHQYHQTSLYAPLLVEPVTSPTLSDDTPVLSVDDGSADVCLKPMGFDLEAGEQGKFAVVLVHGFGGGVFSWRHVTNLLSRQVGCTVLAFDRPGWGLTSRPRRKDWEDKNLPNPYELGSQVDLLISFCSDMGLRSVVLVGHDDGGLLALKAAEKLRASGDSRKVEVKGVVLIGVSLSREVIPAFARILLHTPLRKKHMVRPLLRTEITQVINRRAWFDATKLTTDVLNLYKAPLFVEGWDEALHEVGRLSFSTVLSSKRAADLLRSVEDLPVLVVAGSEDALVSSKSTQVMASRLVNSRLVTISNCGHLPHEECPKALLSALSPFISGLVSSDDSLQRL
ncbi:alpha/beta hydrolase-like [Oryza sativa Japonica Group]|uniref:Alpha/beta hydrolase-like n=6 Tax=Oryza TaxID=4527 RepID=Q5VQT5_ORYSJ|nr:uncharacterized protein LOC4326243 [Oryza sativa Japonica Group]XP_052166760.1 uncharacterized protein LOC127783607 [Oryza glaberrima]EEC71180.1 hypothetical protein OsI_03062 [Oryza sativa Indica Group]KAB8082682.1 hypothetical protein EE612_004657 [Oryza sativa]EEE50884.1 hypothetical protein OsJ_31362 [Oryza sativa Japonica Group]KAF2951416.1 hypothetical protein DAI22_01g260400 [Oryza sativa Japonica Group]BAD68190.1 alpha/beta hydrolase-like [Oryza sativa Japonica Group]|eukprot:NP_001043711.1 Os01g0647700 [Oryza sativa Japonica Group]